MVIKVIIGLGRFHEKSELSHDDDWRWGHMTTNLVESINSVLNKTQNISISALVKSTYTRCNALFNQIGREVVANDYI